MEVILRRGLHAVDAVAPFGDVEIKFNDAALGHEAFQRHCQREFQHFTDGALHRQEEQVFGGLLADGAAAFDAGFVVVHQLRGLPGVVGGLQGFPVEAVVDAEGVVLGCHRAVDDARGDFAERCPLLVERFAFEQALHHERCERGRHEHVECRRGERQHGDDAEPEEKPAEGVF